VSEFFQRKKKKDSFEILLSLRKDIREKSGRKFENEEGGYQPVQLGWGKVMGSPFKRNCLFYFMQLAQGGGKKLGWKLRFHLLEGGGVGDQGEKRRGRGYLFWDRGGAFWRL